MGFPSHSHASNPVPLVVAQTDVGPILKAILEDPVKWQDVVLPIVTETLTLAQIVEIYGRVRNVPTRAVFLDHAENMPAEWIDMLRNIKEVGCFPAYKGRENELGEEARKIFPGMKTWEAWLKEDDSRLDYVRQ